MQSQYNYWRERSWILLFLWMGGSVVYNNNRKYLSWCACAARVTVCVRVWVQQEPVWTTNTQSSIAHNATHWCCALKLEVDRTKPSPSISLACVVLYNCQQAINNYLFARVIVTVFGLLIQQTHQSNIMFFTSLKSSNESNTKVDLKPHFMTIRFEIQVHCIYVLVFKHNDVMFHNDSKFAAHGTH